MSQFRLVGYIIPKSSWGIQEDENEFPKIASKDEANHPQYGIKIVKTGPPRGEPNGLMVYITDTFYVPGSADMATWREFQSNLAAAIELPVLHREDFTYLSELE